VQEVLQEFYIYFVVSGEPHITCVYMQQFSSSYMHSIISQIQSFGKVGSMRARHAHTGNGQGLEFVASVAE